MRPCPPQEVVAFAILACELFLLGLPVFLGRGSPVLSLRSHNLEKSLHVWSLSSLTMTQAFSGLFWWQLVSWFSRAYSSITLTVSAFNLPKKTSVSCDLTVWAEVLCHSDCLVCLLPCSPVLHTEWGSRASLCSLEVNKYLKFILGQGKRGECEFVWVFLTLKLSKTVRWQHREKGQAFLTVSYCCWFHIDVRETKLSCLQASLLTLTRDHQRISHFCEAHWFGVQCSSSLTRLATSGCRWEDSPASSCTSSMMYTFSAHVDKQS